VLRDLFRSVLRALAWSALAAAALTGVLAWRTDPMFRLGAHQIATWFGVCWALSFVPCLALELGVRHLLAELGRDDDG
jgi:hypothetical protein